MEGVCVLRILLSRGNLLRLRDSNHHGVPVLRTHGVGHHPIPRAHHLTVAQDSPMAATGLLDRRILGLRTNKMAAKVAKTPSNMSVTVHLTAMNRAEVTRWGVWEEALIAAVARIGIIQRPK